MENLELLIDLHKHAKRQGPGGTKRSLCCCSPGGRLTSYGQDCSGEVINIKTFLGCKVDCFVDRFQRSLSPFIGRRPIMTEQAF